MDLLLEEGEEGTGVEERVGLVELEMKAESAARSMVMGAVYSCGDVDVCTGSGSEGGNREGNGLEVVMTCLIGDERVDLARMRLGDSPSPDTA